MAKAGSTIAFKIFKSTTNGVDLKNGLPERLKLLDWGSNDTNQGKVIVDETTLAAFDANQHRLGRDTIHFDFNHSTVPGTDAYAADKEPRAIAGYGIPHVVRGEGLFIDQVSTTPTGIKSAPDFKDLSPAVLTDEKTGRVLGLHSVALTPAGSVYNLTIENAALQALTSLMSDTSKPTPKAYGNGQPDYSGLMKEQMDTIRKALKMEGSSDEELFNVIMAKMGVGKEGPITNAGNSQTVTWPFGMDYKVMSAALAKEVGIDLQAQLVPLTAEITKLKAELETRKKADETSEKNQLLDAAGKEGKVLTLSAATLELTPVSALKEIIAGLPKAGLPTRPVMKILSADQRKQKPTREDAVAAINRMVSEQAPGEYRTENN